MDLDRPFSIRVTNERRTQRTRILELLVLPSGKDDSFLAIASLYGDELHINLPANPDANGFLAWLSGPLGPPVETPVIKCSAPWGEHMIGPMQTATWKLDPGGLAAFDTLFKP